MKQTITTVDAIDAITDNLDSLDGDAIAHLYELVFGGHATGIDGGLEWEPENDDPEEVVAAGMIGDAERIQAKFFPNSARVRDPKNPEGDEFDDQ